MHEVSIINSCMELVFEIAKKNQLKRVDKIKLTIGELSGVMADSLIFAYENSIQGTIAEKAELVIETASAMGKCRRCNLEFKIDHFNKLCPLCRGFCDEITAGYELNLNSIEGE